MVTCSGIVYAVKDDAYVVKCTTSYYETPRDLIGTYIEYIYVNSELFIDPIRLRIMEMVTVIYTLYGNSKDCVICFLMGVDVVGWIFQRFKTYYFASNCKFEFAILQFKSVIDNTTTKVFKMCLQLEAICIVHRELFASGYMMLMTY